LNVRYQCWIDINKSAASTNGGQHHQPGTAEGMTNPSRRRRRTGRRFSLSSTKTLIGVGLATLAVSYWYYMSVFFDSIGTLPQSSTPTTHVPTKPAGTRMADDGALKADTGASKGSPRHERFDESVPERTPTHSACRADDVQGIYHIAIGDIGGASGTIFFQFVIAQILYAEQHGLKPWVYLSNVSHVVYDNAVHGAGSGVTLAALTGRDATYVRRYGGLRRDFTPGPPDPNTPVKSEVLHFAGTGVWEHYFEPISDFVPGDTSCAQKLYVTMDIYLITPGLHRYAEYAPRCWRYNDTPDYINKPHLGLTEWLEPQRKAAYAVTQKYFKPRSYLKAAATRINPDCSLKNPCLGLHIRHSDKGDGRRLLETADFLPFAQAFLQAAAAQDTTPHIYLATDSTLVLEEIERTWPSNVRNNIRTAGDDFLRSTNEVAVFDLDGASQHHRTNKEVLIEIVALASCQFMIHGLSAVTESAIWMTEDLHDQSVNLEDPNHMNAAQFSSLVHMVLTPGGAVQRDQWPRPVRSVDVWPALFQEVEALSTHSQTNQACEGFDGILLISTVGQQASAGAAFFTSVLNQLIFAGKHNLKPWVHLRSNDTATALVYDDKIHGVGSTAFEMMHGMAVSTAMADESSPPKIYPNFPARREAQLSSKQFLFLGSGIWNSYFEPVSDFVPGDKSCRNKPLIEMEPTLVSPGLDLYAPWSVRAWHYDNVADGMWWNEEKGSNLKDFYQPMRKEGSEMVQQFYRFHPYIQRRAEQVNPIVPGQPCLGIHLRNGDKMGDQRDKIAPDMFEPYVDAFEKAGGRAVFVASDSHKVLQYINNTYPDRLTNLIRSQGPYVVRSTNWPAHYIEDHHRVNAEVLVDILALSKCQLLLHGFSTVSEAAIYLNPSLHTNSVNLEDPGRLSSAEFERLVAQVLAR
jgi:hypothetical protein